MTPDANTIAMCLSRSINANIEGVNPDKIYALVFKKKAPIDFMNRNGFAHSAAFLRVNKLVYNEARVFLYSKNHFLFGHNFSKLGAYYEPVWKELGWSHIRRFFTDIGPENTSLIQKVGIYFCDATPSGNPGTSLYVRLKRENSLQQLPPSKIFMMLPYVMRSASYGMHADSKTLDTNIDQRRYTYNEDLSWILNHLSEHGRILKLKLSFGGRRSVVMSTRDKDFLIALKGVKTDRLDIGDPNPGSNYKNDVGFRADSLVLVQSMLIPKLNSGSAIPDSIQPSRN